MAKAAQPTATERRWNVQHRLVSSTPRDRGVRIAKKAGRDRHKPRDLIELTLTASHQRRPERRTSVPPAIAPPCQPGLDAEIPCGPPACWHESKLTFGDHSELAEHAELIKVGLVLHDLAVGDTQQVDLGPPDSLAVRRRAEEVARVVAVT